MGLSASQARLLTITARKSDCEFQSMRYSHQKIALSRSMTDLSTKYQNSLDQTKLVYNFYGESDTTTPLSYGLLMTPSQMNGYLPTLITDASGKVVLSSPYAAAARAAGIPQEGLGCLPSSTTRNKFLEALAKNGVISNETAETCMGIEYAQSMGMGTTDLVTTKVEQMNINELLDYLSNYQVNFDGFNVAIYSEGSISTNPPNIVTFKDLLENDYAIYAVSGDNDTKYDWSEKIFENMGKFQSFSFWEDMFDTFESALDTGDPAVQKALSDARARTEALIYVDYPDDWGGQVNHDSNEGKMQCGTGFGAWHENWKEISKKIDSKIKTNAHNFIGYYGERNRGKSGYNSGLSISVSNIFKAYLTYFLQALEGTSSGYYVDDTGVIVTGIGGNNNKITDGNQRTVSASNLVDLDCTYEFNVVTDTDINTDQALISGFYDAIFNQLCTRGWVENNNITDDEYMQDMLKTGKLFLATCAEDGYYYQGNYKTNSYISEISDEEAITKAEAEYNTEKQKLTHKEEIIDLKMKNLDTEISSLTTEYDTVKSLISKNIEKGFKRYDA